MQLVLLVVVSPACRCAALISMRCSLMGGSLCQRHRGGVDRFLLLTRIYIYAVAGWILVMATHAQCRNAKTDGYKVILRAKPSLDKIKTARLGTLAKQALEKAKQNSESACPIFACMRTRGCIADAGE